MTRHIPKAELHCHIEGAAPTELVRQQARKYSVDIDHLIDGKRFVWDDFTSFLAAYDAAAALFKTEEDYALLAESYLASIASEGALYSEIFISPDHARLAGLSPQAYVNGLGEGIERARDKYGIEGRQIITCVRHFDKDAAIDVARFAAARPHRTVTGFGMGGDERIGSHADFSDAFDIARDAGLGITTHAGEIAGAESVRDALEHVRPARIGHGVRAIEDMSLVEHLANEGIVLEVCPGSNVSLSVYESFGAHPFRTLMDAGVKVTLNSDDPPFFDTSLGKEYAIAQAEFGLSDEELVETTRTAINAAFVDEDTRTSLLAKL
ncbi:adenosine deaminase [Hoeflea prorocentri]|uniref:Adenine deaminase n=1 Tax=Hoeflea prorocentri TaxID=1922333 RepID=A0A9X3ZJ08_9HYPH|nr:adenosine deaminase [Hoeflea prorocentri]MCY6382979.1 adenosine deaminase [Hoeflea prorocentri]MDA5400779.1 adenosine deaminase [Hoeflea prorocentri]